MAIETTKEQRQTSIDEAIERGGGIVAFSKAMGISHQAIYGWRKRGFVPFTRAVQVEALCGIPCAKLVEPAVARALETPSASANVL